MNPSDPASPGFVTSLRRLGDGLLASVQERVELFSVELAEEKFRLIQTFVWISVAMFAGVMAVTFVSLTLVYLFWETAQLAVLAGFALVYTGGAIAIVLAFRRYLARQPKPFVTTLAEIEKDRACIREES